MKALLDTNIIIHRETHHVVSQDIGTLYRWLDRGGYIKCVHSYTIAELERNSNEQTVASFKVKLNSYETIEIPSPIHPDVEKVSSTIDSSDNDKVDSVLLNEVYVERVDILITEDKKIHLKAKELGVSEKVFTIDSFLEKTFSDHPELVDYKVLNVRKSKFGHIDLNDTFFDSLKNDYTGFDKWFLKKYDEDAYITYNTENRKLLSFLYLKVEDESENYSNIAPIFPPKRRLKVGTFKVISNGFRLGERFLKIIFDNALKNKVDEIYVTIFNKRPEQQRLIDLIEQWGFRYWGKKGEEFVYVRDFKPSFSVDNIKGCFPYISRKNDLYMVSIYPDYHTELLPDSILNTESPEDFVEDFPHRNSISKVYVSRAKEPHPKVGDVLIFYRTGGYRKGVISTLAIVQDVKENFKNLNEFLAYCNKSSVFPKKQLIDIWNYSWRVPFAIRFLYTYSFPHRINMQKLIELNILSGVDDAPRGFRKITKEQFDTILKETRSDESFIID